MNPPSSIDEPARTHAQGAGRERSLGAILIDSGRLSADGAEKIIREQKAHGLRFGDAAIRLGLLTQDDVDFALARQFDYPYLGAGDTSLSENIVAAYRPTSAIVEQLRALRSQLMVRWFGDEPNQRALTVVSADRREGRSFIAANLAVVFSQLGERTLLIDADLRYPSQQALFKLDPRTPGLSSVLSGRANGEAIIRIPSLLGLSVLPAGALPPNPQELIARPQFGRLIERVCESFDVVIIDTPASDTAADFNVISSRAKASLVVARRDHTPEPKLNNLSKTLHAANVAVVGAVLNAY
ncbi:chain length determinant protein tyrosine kinase EpsG [Niveibacterium microcysteis]|uniref:Chain length determinant protein tyrosine kinase EpsG n=1 Tax=Niveibacterium microcysteis TaxID=2811415 RepID=A0ABX7MCP0_9RHOO|nr:chain length determinant protein tyrosine kinase EpsG [Niveibacterium microcysteis]QSI79023.1 chain length determinant protein tyrosine kinase EpsG [Niveibacterium microcysteis]